MGSTTKCISANGLWQGSGSDRAWYPTGLRRHGAGRGVLAKARPFRPSEMLFSFATVLGRKGTRPIKVA
jgi:hypothetical protein